MNSVSNRIQLCISISAKPGRFGEIVHNGAYRALRLPFFYKACEVANIGAAILAVRTLGIRGCSVSMPFKTSVISLLDSLDEPAEKIGAVNTIVNDGGRLTGFNTDTFGARKSLAVVGVKAHDRILVLGAGGVSRAIVWAIKAADAKPIVAVRKSQARKKIEDEFQVETVAWEEREKVQADYLVNATPIGMDGTGSVSPFAQDLLKNYKGAVDVVVSTKPTQFVCDCQDAGIRIVNGLYFSIFQASEQFFLYTGEPAPLMVMLRLVEENLGPVVGSLGFDTQAHV